MTDRIADTTGVYHYRLAFRFVDSLSLMPTDRDIGRDCMVRADVIRRHRTETAKIVAQLVGLVPGERVILPAPADPMRHTFAIELSDGIPQVIDLPRNEVIA